MKELYRFLATHRRLTRRFFLGLGAAGSAAVASWPLIGRGEPAGPELAKAIAALESFFTSQADFRDVSRGKPLPHSLPDEKKREVGLTRESWKLEVVSDPDNPAKLGRELTKADGTALDFAGLLELGEKHAVRFAKVMTCLNIGCPLGMGIWEGVPLREIVWLTKPREDVRRVFYYGYHNDDAKQLFQSSLPLGRVLEDFYDLPPVILCYKLNGQWLDSPRGGPVRVVVPEGYGFKSIKWLSHVVLTNLSHANDTYANGNNDVDSPLKSFAATLSAPTEFTVGQPMPITGHAQVGISGLSKVQVWITPSDQEWPADDKNFLTAPWLDAQILGPPPRWGGNLPDDEIPSDTLGFDASGRPRTWPMRLAKAHWAILLPGLAAGEYTLRSRTIDEKGIPQPMPRPFRKSGHSAIESISIRIKD
ncbi:MAG TPA: molybdopterin-dependent oxidoreductase [Pirellulaceae bacterium]|nr:molybdopterin-dependent oxidoreductase [Pirellulaceae bacterium]